MVDVVFPEYVVLCDGEVGGSRSLVVYLAVPRRDFDRIWRSSGYMGIATGAAEMVDIDGATVIMVPISEGVRVAVPVRSDYMDIVYETGRIAYFIVPCGRGMSEEKCIGELKRLVDAVNKMMSGEDADVSEAIFGILDLSPPHAPDASKTG